MDSERAIKSRIIAYLDGEIDSRAVEELSDWISKSKENAKYFSRVKDLWESSLANASQIADTENGKNSVQQFFRKKNQSPLLLMYGKHLSALLQFY